MLALALVGLNLFAWAWVRQSWMTAEEELRVVDVFPLEALDESTYVSLVFNHDLVDLDAVGVRLDDPPFTVRPAVDGFWEWISPRQLSLQLARPLPAGQIFEIRPKRDVARRFGERLVGKQTFVLKTRALEMKQVEVRRCDNEHATLRFEFNQPVDPTELLARLTIHAGGSLTSRPPLESLTPRCRSREPSESIEVEVTRPADVDRLQVRVDGGLLGVGAVLPLGEAVDRDLRLPERFEVDHRSVSAPRLGEPVRATISLTHGIDPSQSLDSIEVEPAVDPLRVELRWDDIHLRGRFEPGRRYTVTLPAGFRSKSGILLGQAERVVLTVPEYEPQVRFPADDGILSPHGNRSLEVSVVNVPELKFELWRVHPNNLVAHLRDDGWRATARPLATQRARMPAGESSQSIMLDLERLVGDAPGIYRLDAEASDERWVEDTALVRVTDLALTERTAGDERLVWVTSIRDGTPLEHVEVAAYSLNNQVLAFARTDSNGLARLARPSNHPDGEAFVLTARRGADLNYLRPGRRDPDFDASVAGARPYPASYEALVYGERGVYRPGDSVHVTAILRDGEGRVPPAFPVELRVYRPDGQLVHRAVASPDAPREAPRGSPTPAIAATDEATAPVSVAHRSEAPDASAVLLGQGIAQFSVPTSPSAATGLYRLEVGLPVDGTRGSGSNRWGVGTVRVEAFVPVRLEVEAHADTTVVPVGTEPEVTTRARYIFGTPAAGLATRVHARWQPVVFRSEREPEYDFHPAEPRSERFEERAQVLDPTGEVTTALADPAQLDPGLWRVFVSTTVTAPGSRSVSAHAELEVDRQGRYLGSRLPDAPRVNEPATFGWIQRTVDDEPADPGPVEVELTHLVWKTELREVSGRPTWQRVVEEFVVDRRTLNEDGAVARGEWSFTPEESGRYRLRALDVRSGRTTEVEFFVRGFGETVATASHPERVEVAHRSGRIRAGETIELTLRAPFAGRALLSLESDRVDVARIVTVDAGEQSVAFELPPRLRGGAYVNVTLIRPVDPNEAEWLPHRAHGTLALRVDHSDDRIPVALSAATDARPGAPLSIVLRTPPTESAARAWVHLWAVDESLLLPTGYRVTDPWDFFLAPRQRSVLGSDIFDELLPDHRGPAELTYIGGDSNGKVALRRLATVTARREAPAVVWRRAEPIPADGVLTVTLGAPDRPGALRVMAVVVDGDHYGAASHVTRLKSPITIEVSAPRAVAPGDEFEIPVTVFNQTEREIETIDLELVHDETIAVDAISRALRGLAPGTSETIIHRATAADAGPVSLRVEARDRSRPDVAGHATCEFVVRRVTPLHREVSIEAIAAGESRTWTVDSATWVPDRVRTTVRVSGRSSVELIPTVERLLDYPYGCAEQTSSRLLALSRAPEWAESLGLSRSVIERKIERGLLRWSDLQRPSGGLSYWPGHERTDLWASAYAAHVAGRLERSGVSLAPDFVARLSGYLERALQHREIESLDREALVLRALGALGRPQYGRLERLTEELDSLDAIGRLHLAVAWFEAGRRDAAESVLDRVAGFDRIPVTTAGRIASPVRGLALWVEALSIVRPEDPALPLALEQLAAARTNGSWGNTLENATAVAALCEFQARNPVRADFTGSLSADGVEHAFESATPTTWTTSAATLSLTSEGEGSIPVILVREGLAAEAPAPFDRGLSVRRQWLDSRGAPIEGDTIELGALVWVELRIEGDASTRGRDYRNLAVVDLLPGGFEAENPNLETSAAGRTYAGAQASAGHTERLDDRVVSFVDLPPSLVAVVRYPIRATAVGTFRVPGVEASSMYDPELASLDVARSIRVVQP